ncbi:hypothetical protein OA405_02360 [Bacteroidota bacterium]|nr:hypothetical protein [Bacteroidota bacterium]
MKKIYSLIFSLIITLSAFAQTGIGVTTNTSSPYSFTATNVDSTTTQSITLVNTVAAPQTVSLSGLSAPFSASQSTLTIPASDSISFDISFNPTSTGNFSDTLDWNGSVFGNGSLVINGEGVQVVISISNDELNKRFTFSNINVIKKTLKQNKSVIVVVGHYGNWEWALRSASNLINTKIIGVYKRINNRIFEWLLLKIRSNTKVFPVEIKSLSRELVNNNEKKIYAIVADQSPTLEQSNVRINFLNRDTLVYTGVEKISKKYNMPVFYLNIKLTRKGYYESTFEEICRKNINGKNLEITKEFFSKLENQIKSEPRLWLWSHKRWKHTN